MLHYTSVPLQSHRLYFAASFSQIYYYLCTISDFVNAARQVLAFQLNDHSLSTSAVQFAVQDVNAATATTEMESYEKVFRK